MNYKKGNLVALTYCIDDAKFYSVGIVLDVLNESLKIGHNFKKTNPIDVTNVPVKNIVDIKIVIPKEINVIYDIV